MYDIIALGELLIDFTTINTDESGYPTMAAHPGGAPANFLAAASSYGLKAGMIGKVGDDAFGKLLTETLRKSNISTEGIVETDEYFTTLAFVTLDSNGDRKFSFARKPGADTSLEFEEIDCNILDGTKALHFGTLSLTDEPAAEATRRAINYVKEKGKLLTFDPNLRKPLWNDLNMAREAMEYGLRNADIVKISDDEIEFLWGCPPEEGAKKILNDYGVKLVFVTCGSKGCYYKNRNASGFIGALQGINAVDTTGAGDIFGGSAVSQVMKTGKKPEDLNKEELREIASFASTAAGLSVTRPGGISSVPTEEDILSHKHQIG